MTEPNSTSNDQKMTMNGWGYAASVVLLLVGAIANLLFAGGVFFAFHRSHQNHSIVTTSIIFKSQILISGPSVEMSLPAGIRLTSAYVNADGGNWWYETDDSVHLHLLIAASKISVRQQAISDDYFQRVLRIVEESDGNQITSMGAIEVAPAGQYSSRQGTFDTRDMDGSTKHAAALLARREGDDLLVVLYGDYEVKDQVDRAAEEMFGSLLPMPTPQSYDVHSAMNSPKILAHAFLRFEDEII